MADRSVSVILRAQVEDFKRQMDAASKSVKGVGEESEKSTTRASTGMGRMVQSATENRAAWETAGTTLMGFGAASTAVVGASVVAAVRWESAWAGVTKTVDGSTEQMAALEAELRQMATTLPATHQEIAAVAEAAGQLGVARGDIASFTKTMIDLGETTNLSADEAATSIAQLMNVMQTAPEDVDNLGASLVALGNDGASTERDIVQMAQRIAGAGAIIGLTEGEVLGLANALASAGIEVEAGGSAISNIMIDISKSVSSGGEDLEKWARLAGLSADEFAAAWKGDPAQALAQTIEGLGDLNAAGGDVFGTLSDLGQSDVRVTRALLSMANSGDLLRESLELGNRAWSENTALLAEAEKRYDTTEAKLQIAKNSINDAAISLGENLLPALASGAEGIASLAQAFSGLPDSVQTTVGIMGGLVGVTTLAGGAFLTFFPRIIETRNAFKTLNSAGSPIPGMLGKIGAAAGIAVGVTALATAFVAVADAIGDSRTALSVSKTTEALLELGDVDLDGVFRDLGGAEERFDGVGEAANRLLSDEAGDRFYQWGASVSRGLGITTNELANAETQFKAVGDSLALMVSSGDADKAAALFEAIYSGIDTTKYSTDDLISLMPAYSDALAAANVAQEGAAVGAEGLATSMGAVDPATEAATAAMEEWAKSAQSAGDSFSSIVGAYQSVIDKNVEIATSTAEATESTKDSWEDFYDGTTVGMDDWIAKLQEQRESTENWASNYRTALDQVVAEVPAAGQSAALGFIEEMTLAGEEGAAALQAFVDGTPEQRQTLVDAWAGTNAAISDVMGTPPKSVIEPDLESADRANAAWSARLTAAAAAAPAQAAVDANTAPADATMATWQEMLRGFITPTQVDANLAPGQTKVSKFWDQLRGTTTPTNVSANDAPARSTVAGTTWWIQQQNPFITTSANDDPARSTIGAVTSRDWRTTITASASTSKAEADLSFASRARTAIVNLVTQGGAATGGPIQFRAGGGPVRGPGTGTSDSIPAIGPQGQPFRLSNGEHVWTTAEVAAAGGHGAMYALRAAARRGQVARFANGGEVGGFNPRATVPASSGAPSVHVTAPAADLGDVVAAFTDDQIERIAAAVEGRVVRTLATGRRLRGR